LKEYTGNITVCDPWAYPNMVKKAYGIDIEPSIDKVKDKNMMLSFLLWHTPSLKAWMFAVC
jgi:hypothetical protein